MNIEWYILQNKLIYCTSTSGVANNADCEKDIKHVWYNSKPKNQGSLNIPGALLLTWFNFNSLAPGAFKGNFIYEIFYLILVIDGGGISCEIVLRKMSSDLTDDKSTLVQVMV